MKKLLLLIIIVFLVAEAQGQSLPAFKRNDNHATVLQSNNLGNSSGAANDKGQIYIKNIEDPVPVAPGVTTVTVTPTNPTITNNADNTVLASNASRIDCQVQNNTSGNICVGEGIVLTGIVPTLTNICTLLVPQAVYTCGAPFPFKGAVHVFQLSGGSTNLISVSEKQ